MGIIEEVENTETVTDDGISGETEEIEGAEPLEEDVTELTDDPPKKSGIEKKIGKLTREKSEALREAAYWKGVAEGKTQAKEDTVVEEKPKTKLDPTDFETYEDYLDARDAKIREEVKSEILGEQKAKEKAQNIHTIQKQYGDARKVHDDFDEVALNPSLPINQLIIDVAMGENFAEILYELGKNPEKAAQISAMTSIQAAREIGKIEERILNPKKPTKTKTKAPEPLKPLGGGGNADATPIEKMSFKQKQAKWEKERLERLGVK